MSKTAYDRGRTCEECGARMGRFIPRTRVGEQLLCTGCVNRMGEAITAGLKVIAHDAGEGEQIFHCPFCGGGSVVGNSDGTVKCNFCNATFTVQVQPDNPGMPQTIDGEPYDNPEMPGEVGGEVAEAPGEEAPQTEGGFGDEDTTDEGGSEEDEDAGPFDAVEKAVKAPNPFTSYKTDKGVVLGEQDFLRHLAFKFADDRGQVKQSLIKG